MSDSTVIVYSHKQGSKQMTTLRQKLSSDITLSETLLEDNVRKYTATICGFRNWHLATRDASKGATDIIAKAYEIRDRINAGDDAVFNEKGPFINA